MPIWIGGRTYRSLRRAVELGDGWVPFGLPVRDMAAMLERARATDEWAARTTPLEIALQTSILDPIGEPDDTRGRLEHLEEIGATAVETRVKNDSLEECLDQLTALRELWPG
jgi:alkanesulfonate monooxygenase SsuD/methylene tetrahydromethanopterin reductase-like flavin-dependent oxidoreductase (luciferase family)